MAGSFLVVAHVSDAADLGTGPDLMLQSVLQSVLQTVLQRVRE